MSTPSSTVEMTLNSEYSTMEVTSPVEQTADDTSQTSHLSVTSASGPQEECESVDQVQGRLLASLTPSSVSGCASANTMPQSLDAESERREILGLQGDSISSSQTDPTASPTKSSRKKKKKRPKSAHTSSSHGSASSKSVVEGDEAEVMLSVSIEAMELSGAGASSLQASISEVGKSRKKKKRKKNDREVPESGQNAEVTSTIKAESVPKVEHGEGSAVQVPHSQQRLPENAHRGKSLKHKQERLVQQRHPLEVNHHQSPNKPCRAQGGAHKKHQNKKNLIFEPYWSMEKVAEGLKKGSLIEGRIRINPKNYEDAYVPLPDGTADVYISGMPDRNRALNGDQVAVLLQDRNQWRVFKEELDNYEKSCTPPKCEGPFSEIKTDDEIEPKTDNDEEGPDVVIEDEEEVELDSAGNFIASSRVVRPARDLPQATPSLQIKQSPVVKKGGNTPASSCKKKQYLSVKEAMDQGSVVVRRLFENERSRLDEGTDKADDEKVSVDKFMQRTGKVVAIIEKKHSRACSGNLRPMQDTNHNFAIFAPSDPRVPRIMIATSDLPAGFKERPEDFTNVLFIARITEWNEAWKMPKGTLAKSLGMAGQVEPETEALLIENDVDSSEFSDEVLACLPQELPWTIPAKELEWRRDLRKECVFTIDPSTARDLDDALHCKDLGDGVYEVGVHIADVSYFVEEHTKLDEAASSRATSVYLVQKVIPMLPRMLCEQLCSLNPGEDRLSFSVIWKMTETGQILEEWFGRTVMCSCVKLSYDHAQGFIEEPDREWKTEELPPISGGFTVEDIRTRILTMDKMAKAMRKARFDSGALRLDQVKLQYTLDQDTGLPNGYFVYQQRESNKLVEEFMLLANMAVAHKIRSAYKDKALLRRHPPPQSRMIDELKETCCSLGFPMEVNSAKEIQLSLARYTGQDELSQARLQVLVVLCSKPMQNAKYFCCGVLEDESLYRHYALNVPLYTHFTSPIRRYPDVLVHRTLAAALGYCSVTERHSGVIQQIAEHCNDKKTNAKFCSDKSSELYFSIFVKEAGPLEEKGMVMAVLDKSFDVYILRLGVVKRVYCEKLPLESFSFHKQGKRPELSMVWQADDGCPRRVTQKISIFSSVACKLQSEPESLRWSAIIHRPVGDDATLVE